MYDTENEALNQDANNSQQNNEPKQHFHNNGQFYAFSVIGSDYQEVIGVTLSMSCLHYTEQSIVRLLDI